jgi:hypothetical protein
MGIRQRPSASNLPTSDDDQQLINNQTEFERIQDLDTAAVDKHPRIRDKT